jgi:hypothetical protein
MIHYRHSQQGSSNYGFCGLDHDGNWKRKYELATRKGILYDESSLNRRNDGSLFQQGSVDQNDLNMLVKPK